MNEPASLLGSMREAWEFVVFRWDRYVISFDFYDQVGIFFRLRSLWDQFTRELFRSTRGPRATAAAPASPAAAVAGPAASARAKPPFWRDPRVGWVAGALLVALAGAVHLLRKREEWNATHAYLALRATLAGSGLGMQPWLGPLALAEFAQRRLPEAAPAAGRLIASYLRESFAGEALAAESLTELKGDLATVDRAAAAAVAARRRERRVRK